MMLEIFCALFLERDLKAVSVLCGFQSVFLCVILLKLDTETHSGPV